MIVDKKTQKPTIIFGLRPKELKLPTFVDGVARANHASMLAASLLVKTNVGYTFVDGVARANHASMLAASLLVNTNVGYII